MKLSTYLLNQCKLLAPRGIPKDTRFNSTLHETKPPLALHMPLCNLLWCSLLLILEEAANKASYPAVNECVQHASGWYSPSEKHSSPGAHFHKPLPTGTGQLPTNPSALTAVTSRQLDPLPAALSFCHRLNSGGHTPCCGDKLTLLYKLAEVNTDEKIYLFGFVIQPELSVLGGEIRPHLPVTANDPTKNSAETSCSLASFLSTNKRTNKIIDEAKISRQQMRITRIPQKDITGARDCNFFCFLLLFLLIISKYCFCILLKVKTMKDVYIELTI